MKDSAFFPRHRQLHERLSVCSQEKNHERAKDLLKNAPSTRSSRVEGMGAGVVEGVDTRSVLVGGGGEGRGVSWVGVLLKSETRP